MARSFESFQEELINKYGEVYEFLSDFKNMSTKIKVKHTVCDYVWDITPSNLLNGSSNDGAPCPRCNKREQWNVYERVHKLVDEEYTILKVSGSTTRSRLWIRHNVCLHEWETAAYGFIYHGRRCPLCNGNAKYTTERFKKTVFDLVGDDYEVLGEYENNYTEIEMIHHPCSNKFFLAPTYFMHGGSRCPFCKDGISKGEKAITDYLLSKNINFIPEHTFPDCKNINTLPFDFAIFDNEKLIMLIEFDGKQHYEPVEWFGGQESLEQIKYRDSIKNNYCKYNNIPLVRIPYWEQNNISDILELVLSERSSECSFFVA